MEEKPLAPSGHIEFEEEAITFSTRLSEFPWWFVALVLIAVWVFFIIFTKDFLFEINPDFINELNAGQVTEELQAVFDSNDKKLSLNAEVTVQNEDRKWKIEEGKKVFFIKAKDQSLEIYSWGNYGQAFNFIKIGLRVTIQTALTAYAFALILGLIAGLGRLSNNIFFNNLARLYVELIRGVPILVLIFFIALVGVPAVVNGLNGFGEWLTAKGVGPLGAVFTAFNNQNISMNARAIVALAVTYGAYLAEIFRAGIQSIEHGQMEAARSLGMSYAQSMRYIILPQAIRNVLPALGNDFVAMVKDSSLVSVLAVRDITQVSRLYAGSTFRFREAYVTLSVMYLTMTVMLSMGVQAIERRMRSNDQ
jgi:polar amino acid transport system permease protein